MLEFKRRNLGSLVGISSLVLCFTAAWYGSNPGVQIPIPPASKRCAFRQQMIGLAG